MKEKNSGNKKRMQEIENQKNEKNYRERKCM